MQKLKAYFGMIPADEVDDYPEDDADYGADYRADYGYRPRARYQHDYDDADDFAEPTPRRRDRFVPDYESAPRRTWTPQAAPRPVSATSAASALATAQAAPVRGALAVDPQQQAAARPTPAPQTPPAPAPQASAQPARRENPLATITTLHLRSYSEALKIGEPYREGTPVIMNLTEMADADAKRLVDFAVGMAFALRGDIDKITNKVFLLSPPDIAVTAEDKRRIAEGGYFARR